MIRYCRPCWWRYRSFGRGDALVAALLVLSSWLYSMLLGRASYFAVNSGKWCLWYEYNCVRWYDIIRSAKLTSAVPRAVMGFSSRRVLFCCRCFLELITAGWPHWKRKLLLSVVATYVPVVALSPPIVNILSVVMLTYYTGV